MPVILTKRTEKSMFAEDSGEELPKFEFNRLSAANLHTSINCNLQFLQQSGPEHIGLAGCFQPVQNFFPPPPLQENAKVLLVFRQHLLHSTKMCAFKE
jgi:hypothetical protein